MAMIEHVLIFNTTCAPQGDERLGKNQLVGKM